MVARSDCVSLLLGGGPVFACNLCPGALFRCMSRFCVPLDGPLCEDQDRQVGTFLRGIFHISGRRVRETVRKSWLVFILGHTGRVGQSQFGQALGLLCTPVQVKQVIENLLGNSYEAHK